MLPAVPGKVSTRQMLAYYYQQVRTMCQARTQDLMKREPLCVEIQAMMAAQSSGKHCPSLTCFPTGWVKFCGKISQNEGTLQIPAKNVRLSCSSAMSMSCHCQDSFLRQAPSDRLYIFLHFSSQVSSVLHTSKAEKQNRYLASHKPLPLLNIGSISGQPWDKKVT